jgi:cell filamentation protein
VPGGTVLRNRLDIYDFDELARVEHLLVTGRTDQLQRGDVLVQRTFDLGHQRTIHRHLFGDVYDWAGELRTVELYKDSPVPFATPSDIPRVTDTAAQIIGSTPWGELGKDDFAERMSNVFAWVNYAHPFREGNGRTAKVFIMHVAELSRYRLRFDVIEPDRWNIASMYTLPDRESAAPIPTLMIPVFADMSELRDNDF